MKFAELPGGPVVTLSPLGRTHVAGIRSDYRDMGEKFFGEAPPFDRVIADLKMRIPRDADQRSELMSITIPK